MLAALTYLGGDLRWQLVVAGVIAGVLEPLVFLEANNHGGGGAVVGEDGLLTPVPCPADDLAQVLAGVADRHLTHASNCTTWGMGWSPLGTRCVAACAPAEMQSRLSQLAPMRPPKSAMVTGLLGAKLGANIASHQATPGLAQPKSLQVNGTPCGAWPHLATVRACMACKRSGVRIPLAPHP